MPGQFYCVGVFALRSSREFLGSCAMRIAQSATRRGRNREGGGAPWKKVN
jgi:hypothetical protein